MSCGSPVSISNVFFFIDNFFKRFTDFQNSTKCLCPSVSAKFSNNSIPSSLFNILKTSVGLDASVRVIGFSAASSSNLLIRCRFQRSDILFALLYTIGNKRCCRASASIPICSM